MPRLYSWRAAVNSDKGIVNTFNILEEIRRYVIEFEFGHVRIQIEYIDYLICVHGAKSNRTLPWGVILQ